MDELLERERELAAVEELLGRGGVLVVEGGAGIGKTSLLDAACRRAAGLGQDLLRARGSELEAGFAFGVVRQLFERRVASAGREEREALLAGAGRRGAAAAVGRACRGVGVRHVVRRLARALLAGCQPRGRAGRC